MQTVRKDWSYDSYKSKTGSIQQTESPAQADTLTVDTSMKNIITNITLLGCRLRVRVGK